MVEQSSSLMPSLARPGKMYISSFVVASVGKKSKSKASPVTSSRCVMHLSFVHAYCELESVGAVQYGLSVSSSASGMVQLAPVLSSEPYS